jgi:hypothetical protein
MQLLVVVIAYATIERYETGTPLLRSTCSAVVPARTSIIAAGFQTVEMLATLAGEPFFII